MKHALRALTAGVMILLMLACLPLPPALAQQNGANSKQGFTGGIPAPGGTQAPTEAPVPAETPRPTEAPVPVESPYIGTVIITKSGYQNAQASSTDSTVVFRVHYGERYLCVEVTGNGLYGILLPTDEVAYISSDAANTALVRGQTDEVTLSYIPSIFRITATRKVELYSQPKSGAKMRRISSGGDTETTFYYSKGSELVAFGMTSRGGKDWYLLLGNNNGILEPGWVLASDCNVTSGNPEDNPIPSWWYD